ncbi:DUF6907 domain-containing protein [Leucobacter ruminantium]|uniref:DUF6907 domain-containing protein n=1 Tax=Leucobacter ruminantium TaxID=1289170 RepID=UPI003C7A5191
MNAPKPAWLTEPCPPWCTATHQQQVIEADRRHEGDLTVVPVIVRQPPTDTSSNHLPAEPRTGEVDVTAFRDLATPETWVVIAEGPQSIEFTRESAIRVSLALTELLRQTA